MADQRHRYSVKFLKGDKWLFTMSTDDRDSATDNLAATVTDEHGNHVETFHLLRAVDATEDTGTTLQWAGSSSEEDARRQPSRPPSLVHGDKVVVDGTLFTVRVDDDDEFRGLVHLHSEG